MGKETPIQWAELSGQIFGVASTWPMGQTKEGAIKVAASRVGISVSEYNRLITAGLKWCFACQGWKTRSQFRVDRSRYDGLGAKCADCANRVGRERYVPKPPIKRGKRILPARDGDKKQARGRVNHLVHVGILPDPDTLPCVLCGHLGSGRRHEYYHYKGYSSEFHEVVESLCAKCHKQKG